MYMEILWEIMWYKVCAKSFVTFYLAAGMSGVCNVEVRILTKSRRVQLFTIVCTW